MEFLQPITNCHNNVLKKWRWKHQVSSDCSVPTTALNNYSEGSAGSWSMPDRAMKHFSCPSLCCVLYNADYFSCGDTSLLISSHGVDISQSYIQYRSPLTCTSYNLNTLQITSDTLTSHCLIYTTDYFLWFIYTTDYFWHVDMSLS